MEVDDDDDDDLTHDRPLHLVDIDRVNKNLCYG